MDPQMIMTLLPLLMKLLGGSGGSGLGVGAPANTLSTAGASGAGNPGFLGSLVSGILPGAGGTEIANLLGPLLGEQSGTGSDIGGLIGGGVGLSAALAAIAAGALGPPGLLLSLLPLLGGAGGGLLGGLFNGVPREQKTQNVASQLGASGDPNEEFLSNFINNQVLGQGKVLSSAGAGNEPWMGQILEWLSGSSLPGLNAGWLNVGDASNIPVGRDISRLQQLLGPSPELSSSEIAAFLPQIESIVAGGGSGKHPIVDIAGNIMALIGSVAGQQKAGLGGGSNTPTGTGGNALAAAVGAGGGGPQNSGIMNQIKKLLAQGGAPGSGGTPDLVGVAA